MWRSTIPHREEVFTLIAPYLSILSKTPLESFIHQTEELDKLERDLIESEKQLEDLKRQALSKKEALDQWITETDVAISEARQSADARQQYLKSLQTDIQQNQVFCLV